MSNLDEFQPLKNIPGVRLVWARYPVQLASLTSADWIILPGSKHTSSDLAGLRTQGLDRGMAEHALRGGAVLGMCGGLQMLGEALVGTHGIDGNALGIDLLPPVTRFGPDKTVRRTEARSDTLEGCWSRLSHVAVHGYDIHQGQTSLHPAMPVNARPCKPAWAGKTRPAMCWVSTCMACSKTPPCCRRCSVRAPARWTVCSTAWPIASKPFSPLAFCTPLRIDL